MELLAVFSFDFQGACWLLALALSERSKTTANLQQLLAER